MGAIRHGNWGVFHALDTLIVDEKSMLGESFLLGLYRISINCSQLRIILAGDWGQIPPILPRVKNIDYENCSVVYSICKGTLVQLSKCRRADKKLFKIYKEVELIDNKGCLDGKNVFGNSEYNKSVCYLNETRKSVNQFWMKKLAPDDDYVELEAYHSKDDSQDTLIFNGLPLISFRANKEWNVVNADEFIVQSYDDKYVYLKRVEKDSVKKVSLAKLTEFFAPNYCLTVHRSQGQTFRDINYTIYDWKHMTREMRYVALSRGTEMKYVNIATSGKAKDEE